MLPVNCYTMTHPVGKTNGFESLNQSTIVETRALEEKMPLKCHQAEGYTSPQGGY